MKFNVITFGLLLSLLTLSEAQSKCDYFQNLVPGQYYYVFNNEYPNPYRGQNQCTWRMTSSYPIKINCNISMPANKNCMEEYFSVQFAGKSIDKYCGYGTFTSEGMDVTMNFISPYTTKGGTFLCEARAEKPFDEYNCQCGWKNPSKIVGGKETGINEYPMMAGLVDGVRAELFCGATIISPKHVLTAAHCVDGRNIKEIGVLVGEHDITTGTDTPAAKMYPINKWIIHPQYRDIYNDIAVCEIVGTIDYSIKIGPACLPFQHRYDSFSGSYVTLLGWGLMDFGGAKSNVLREVDVSVITNQQCAKYYYPNKQITRSHMCTYTSGKDSCQMDSGGPALWENPTTYKMVLTSIISAGIGCDSGAPSIYTRVGDYIDWIVSVTPVTCESGPTTQSCWKFPEKMNFKVITFGLLLPFLALSKAQSSDCMRFAKADSNCRCGWKNPTRIVGGSETCVNEYPMMAGLIDFKMKELYCGATIIYYHYILTAAHCVDRKDISTIGALVGEHDINTGKETDATKIYLIEKCTIHPQYCKSGDKNYHDIAICKTKESIKFSAKVGPACLPFQHRYDSFIGDRVTLLGWGMMDFGGARSTKLQGVNVGVMSSQQCANMYNSSLQIACSQMCTYAEGKDSCQMDSGGPVLWQSYFTNNIVLVGITSSGVGCASEMPTINTRVGYYMDWIESVTPDAQYCKVE
ncbi:venom serine protease 34-like [Odontomachus brunneus]|uniref:venom serine protease 34-like n=1 Tax=Odontomachus brunneus TaxID=486640 RepID=UPI0013F2536F|nr:venom serine protease 34-like [Odontomachus brunneus]